MNDKMGKQRKNNYKMNNCFQQNVIGETTESTRTISFSQLTLKFIVCDNNSRKIIA